MFFPVKKKYAKLFFFLNFFLIFPFSYIIFVDPTIFIISNDYKEITYPRIICNDMPICFRVLSLNVDYFFNYIFNKILFFLKAGISSNFGYFFVSYISINLISLYVKRVINDNIISFLCLYYILMILIYYKVPSLRTYDYLVLLYFLYILSNINSLSKNYFSFLNVFLLFIGNLIFEYAGFLFFGSIILFNFLNDFFKRKLFQLKHLFLFFIPCFTFLIVFFIITASGNYYYMLEGNQDPEILYKTYGQYNYPYLVITYLARYSMLLIFIFLLISLLMIYKKQKFFYFLKTFNDKFIKMNICMIAVFLLAVLAGMLISGYQSEWKRQFIPFLFLTTILSGLLLCRIKNNLYYKCNLHNKLK